MFFLTCFIVLVALGVWAAWIEPRRLVTRRYDVPMKGLSKPLTAVVISDLQPNNFHWSAARLTKLFQDIETSETPDIVLWLGDYYNAPTDVTKTLVDTYPALGRAIDRHLPQMDELAVACGALKGRLGNYAILGNHDWAWSGEDTRRLLEAQGIDVLTDDVVTVTDGQTALLQVLGYEDMSSGRIPDYARLHAALDPDLAQIGLSHSPDAFPDAQGGPPLMLSGHTHGGQVRMPFIGPLLLPVEHREYDQGWFQDKERRLFVTVGIGTSLPPFRFLCPPEIVVMTLKSEL